MLLIYMYVCIYIGIYILWCSIQNKIFYLFLPIVISGFINSIYNHFAQSMTLKAMRQTRVSFILFLRVRKPFTEA